MDSHAAKPSDASGTEDSTHEGAQYAQDLLADFDSLASFPSPPGSPGFIADPFGLRPLSRRTASPVDMDSRSLRDWKTSPRLSPTPTTASAQTPTNFAPPAGSSKLSVEEANRLPEASTSTAQRSQAPTRGRRKSFLSFGLRSKSRDRDVPKTPEIPLGLGFRQEQVAIPTDISPETAEPSTGRARRMSLSLKLGSMLSRKRKNEELPPPLPNTPVDSEFGFPTSPTLTEGSGTKPLSLRKRASSIGKRLSRSFSSPNLRADAATSESFFKPDASAPPLPLSSSYHSALAGQPDSHELNVLAASAFALPTTVCDANLMPFGIQPKQKPVESIRSKSPAPSQASADRQPDLLDLPRPRLSERVKPGLQISVPRASRSRSSSIGSSSPTSSAQTSLFDQSMGTASSPMSNLLSSPKWGGDRAWDAQTQTDDEAEVLDEQLQLDKGMDDERWIRRNSTSTGRSSSPSPSTGSDLQVYGDDARNTGSSLRSRHSSICSDRLPAADSHELAQESAKAPDPASTFSSSSDTGQQTAALPASSSQASSGLTTSSAVSADRGKKSSSSSEGDGFGPVASNGYAAASTESSSEDSDDEDDVPLSRRAPSQTPSLPPRSINSMTGVCSHAESEVDEVPAALPVRNPFDFKSTLVCLADELSTYLDTNSWHLSDVEEVSA